MINPLKRGVLARIARYRTPSVNPNGEGLAF
jgi:hypothetical protein